MKKTFAGIVHSEQYDLQTLVLAENAGAAKEKVLAHCRSLGKTFHADQVQIIPFGAPA
jgi:hypothetical protein